jgi:hypothetical protein
VAAAVVVAVADEGAVAEEEAGAAGKGMNMLQKITPLMLVAMAALSAATADAPKTYATPEEARDALLQAAAKGMDAVQAVLGPEAKDIARTGDPVEDKQRLDEFNRRAQEKTQLTPDPVNPNRIEMDIGADEWPFAIPLTRAGGRWYWDLKEGKTEIRNRTIGGNELDAIQVCRGYVEAQQTYAETDRDGNGFHEYARKIISTPGKKDGLYWEGPDSPVAGAFAKAFSEGYTTLTEKPQPFHGYYFKILTSQGAAAKGGARDYIAHDMMIGGFALLAWPAEYGVSGIKTFTINQDGIVYEKDLGHQTMAIARATSRFNPDSTWQETEEPDQEEADQ